MGNIAIKFKTNKKTVKRYLPFIILVLVLVCFWVVLALWFPQTTRTENQISFLIKKGEGLGEIAANLKQEGLIKSQFLFEAFVLSKGLHNGLLAGKYALSPAMTMSEILEKIAAGDTVKEKLTIIEGWDLQDIAKYFVQKKMFKEEEFLSLANSEEKKFAADFDFLEQIPLGATLEGYLFPDTYEIEPGAPLEEILKKFLGNFENKITNDLKQEIANQKKSLFQILTMASLLEKEVKTYEDKQLVAGVLWKRLRNGWPLQVDATLTYITGKGSLDLTKDDLAIDSPYNTYKYYGLPPGPICNPGLESIKAAVYYKNNGFWFYLTTPEGETLFSETLEEHNTKRAKYLK